MQSNFRSVRAGLSFKWSLLVAACAVVIALAPAAGAYPLAGTLALPDLTTVPPPAVAGPDGMMVASLTEPWSFTTTAGTTSGTLTTAVYRETSGTLDFYYQVMNNASSKTNIRRESNTDFDNFQTSVGYVVDSSGFGGTFKNGTVAPEFADRLGGVVGFFSLSPANAIMPGQTSTIYVISTNATSWVAGNAELLDGGSITVAAFQPAGTVPEPATMVMLGGGLLALAGIRRYRR